MWKWLQLFNLNHFFSIRRSWNVEDNRKVFLKLNMKVGLYHVVLRKVRNSPWKITLTPVERQQMPGIEKTDSTEGITCLRCTIYNGGEKVCVTFQRVSDKLNIVLYKYRNNIYLKISEMQLKTTEYGELFCQQVHLLSNVAVFFKRCIVLVRTTVPDWKKLLQNWMLPF